MRRRIPVEFVALIALALVMLAGPGHSAAQAALDAAVHAHLKTLFPAAAAFSAKSGEPPHYKVFGPGQAVTGYAFWTTVLEPLERGYDGPIKILVGMDPKGLLAGIIVVDHHVPYGNFSID